MGGGAVAFLHSSLALEPEDGEGDSAFVFNRSKSSSLRLENNPSEGGREGGEEERDNYYHRHWHHVPARETKRLVHVKGWGGGGGGGRA